MSPVDARAILAWLAVCERYRAFQLVRQGSDGAHDVEKVRAEHPDVDGAFERLRQVAEEG